MNVQKKLINLVAGQVNSLFADAARAYELANNARMTESTITYNEVKRERLLEQGETILREFCIVCDFRSGLFPSFQIQGEEYRYHVLSEVLEIAVEKLNREYVYRKLEGENGLVETIFKNGSLYMERGTYEGNISITYGMVHFAAPPYNVCRTWTNADDSRAFRIACQQFDAILTYLL